MNTKINKILTIITITIIVISAIVFISLAKGTYSVSDKYVVFKGIGQHDEEIIKSCKIGTDGKLASSCVDEIDRICSQWATGKYPGICSNGSCTATYRGKTATELKAMTFSDADTYYCVGGTSRTYSGWGCYVCDADSTIMQWVVNVQPSDSNCPGNKWHEDTSITDDKQCPPPAPEPEPACYQCKANSHIYDWKYDNDPTINGDANCSGGYKKTTKTQSECKTETPACYECKTDSHIMYWKYDGTGDANCSAGYNKTTKTQSECKSVSPACYECKANSHIMTWKYDGTGDANCSGGYTKTTKTQAECKTVSPACYECKADKNIKKWAYDGLGDNYCQGGYNKTNKTEAECKYVPENPPTGQTKAIIAWVIASIAMGCSIWYLKNDALSK